MVTIGEHIVKMEQLINIPVVPPPAWIRKWQTEAEHVLFLAHEAKKSGDIERLQMLDNEAKRLVGIRESRTA